MALYNSHKERMRARTGFVPLLVACAVLVAPTACRRSDVASRAASGTPGAPATAPASGSNVSPSARQVLAWLPGERAASGWRRAGAPQVVGPDNLWESIDGGAEAYLAFGFQELIAVTCSDPALAAEATIEVYRMADSLNAFGIYAQERSPAATFVAIGAEGYTAPNVVNFWNGSYYVKVTAMKTNDRIAASLLKLASDISARIGVPGPPPAGLGRLPSRDQVAHSVKYLPRDILGQSYLVNGFEAQYRIGAKTCRLVTASFDSAADATGAFGRYRKFVSPSAPAGRKVSVPGAADAFAGSDSFNGLIVAARAGSAIVVVLGAPSERAALELIRAFVSAQP